MLVHITIFLSYFLSGLSQSCLSNPSQASCVDYKYPHDNAVADIESICSVQNVFQCKQKVLCDSGYGQGQYCSPFSILKSMCKDMPSISGCKNFQKLCQSNSVVNECNIPILPLPSWKTTQENIDLLCGTMSTAGCPCKAPECDLLETYSTMCRNMKMEMEECNDWTSLCKYIPDWSLCTDLSCISNPSLPICAQYIYPVLEAKNDINLICKMMPSMAECTIKTVCESSISNNPFCNPFSLLKSACTKMASSKLCTNYTTMCLSNLTTVYQCGVEVLPLPTPAALRTNINSICAFMNMEGCAECDGVGGHPPGCDLLMVYATKLCMKMPHMVQCEDWNTMCLNIPDWPLCSMDINGQYPGMAMYFHLGYKEYIFFKSWVPQNGLEFFGACVFLFILCIIHKALRQIQTQTILWQSRPKQNSEPHKNHIRLGDRLILYVGPIRWKDLVQSLLTFFESMLGLIIMLLVMTFNFWILLAVGLGYAVGGLIFARIRILEPQPILGASDSLDPRGRESLNSA